MGENNETVVEQPILENTEMGEQPIVSADQNIVATQNEGLMENDPFQEKSEEIPLQAETGATVEEPQPIVEQQIALDVNIDEVFEGGTKEDEITKIVSDTMGNTPAQPEVTLTEPTIEAAPAPVIEATPTVEAAPQEPVITLEPGPIAETPVSEIPAAEPVVETQIVETPAAEVPVEQPVSEVAIEAPIVPEAPIMPEIPIVPEVPSVETTPQEPVITLEPGPITETTVTENPVVEVPAQEVPVEQPVQEAAPAVEIAPQEATPTEVPASEPVITLEPGPIPETTNPFDGIVPNIETTPVVEEMTPQADFQQAEAAPVIELTPGPIESTAVVETPAVETTPQEPVVTLEPGPISEVPATETPAAEMPIAETPLVEQPVAETPEFTITEAPALEITDITNNEVATPEVSVAETQVSEPVLDPVADFAAATAQPAPEANITLEQVQTEIANQQLAADSSTLIVPTNTEQASIVPVPVTAPVTHETPVVDTSTDENIEKTIVLQSSPLGKVQPVAPIAVKGEEQEDVSEEPTEEIPAPVAEQPTEEKVEEEPSAEEPVMPVVEEQEEKKKININDIDDIAIKMLEKEYKEVEPSTENKKPVNIEKSLYIEIDETEEPKQSRNSKRKLITGEEKFHSNKRVVEQVNENEPIVRFCESCGNIVKKEDVVCSQCGDPIE